MKIWDIKLITTKLRHVALGLNLEKIAILMFIKGAHSAMTGIKMNFVTPEIEYLMIQIVLAGVPNIKEIVIIC